MPARVIFVVAAVKRAVNVSINTNSIHTVGKYNTVDVLVVNQGFRM